MNKTTIEYQKILNKNFIPNYGNRDLCLTKGKGTYVWDKEGKKYLDFTSGISVNAFGHCYNPILDEAHQQLEKLIHSSNLFINESVLNLANYIKNLTGFNSFFCNSGTEANEAAIKFIRKFSNYHGLNKFEIISFQQSFHGRTYGSLAATGQNNLKKNFYNMPEGFLTLPLNDIDCLYKSINENTLAIIIEPLLAEGGLLSLDTDFVKAINDCQKKGIFIICDEIQTGLGRLGTLFGYQKVGLKPNIITLAKALGGGLPLGATLVNEDISKTIELGDHGSTFGGNPVACAMSLFLLKQMKEPFFHSIEKKSNYFREKLQEWLDIYSDLGFEKKIRGQGLLLGLKANHSVDKHIYLLKKAGVLVLKSGNNVIRLAPPLNVNFSEIDEFMKKWKDLIA